MKEEPTRTKSHETFPDFMRRLMAVPNKEVAEKMAEYKRTHKRKKRPKT